MKTGFTVLATALTMAAVSGTAEARSNVDIGLNISSAPRYPVPVYVAPAPVYYAPPPQPVYYAPPAYAYGPVVYAPYTPSYRINYWNSPGHWHGRGHGRGWR